MARDEHDIHAIAKRVFIANFFDEPFAKGEKGYKADRILAFLNSDPPSRLPMQRGDDSGTFECDVRLTTMFRFRFSLDERLIKEGSDEEVAGELKKRMARAIEELYRQVQVILAARKKPE